MGWFIILVAKNPTHLYISRLLSGLSGGGAFAIIPSFVAEIASDSVRGLLGSSMIFVCNFGFLFAFVFGAHCSYSTTPIFVICVCVLFLCTFYFLPETPIALLKRDRIEVRATATVHIAAELTYCEILQEAEKSLRFYQNITSKTKEADEFVRFELARVQLSLGAPDGRSRDPKLRFADFMEKAPCKAMIIGVMLATLNQFCGVFAMLNYTATIFKESGSTMTPNASAIVVAVIQILGSSLSTFLVDRAGRKVSATGYAVSAFTSAYIVLTVSASSLRYRH